MPKFDLKCVHSVIHGFINGNAGAVWFSYVSRSVDYVVRVFACDRDSAQKIIADGMLKLASNDFVKTVLIHRDVADEYGLENYLNHNWYIKFILTEEDGERFIEQLSFHPVEKPLTLADNRVLIPTYKEGGNESEK